MINLALSVLQDRLLSLIMPEFTASGAPFFKGIALAGGFMAPSGGLTINLPTSGGSILYSFSTLVALPHNNKHAINSVATLIDPPD